jgi:hypothetical protein
MTLLGGVHDLFVMSLRGIVEYPLYDVLILMKLRYGIVETSGCTSSDMCCERG